MNKNSLNFTIATEKKNVWADVFGSNYTIMIKIKVFELSCLPKIPPHRNGKIKYNNNWYVTEHLKEANYLYWFFITRIQFRPSATLNHLPSLCRPRWNWTVVEDKYHSLRHFNKMKKPVQNAVGTFLILFFRVTTLWDLMITIMSKNAHKQIKTQHNRKKKKGFLFWIHYLYYERLWWSYVINSMKPSPFKGI